MSLIMVKVWSAIILLIETYAVGIIPVYVVKRLDQIKQRKLSTSNDISLSISITDDSGDDNIILKKKTNKRLNFYIQILTQFGGGVLFATVFAHLLPEVTDKFEEYVQRNDSIFRNDMGDIEEPSLPFVEIAICVGFFIVYFSEELLHSCLHKYFKHLSHDHSLRQNLVDFPDNALNGDIQSSTDKISSADINAVHLDSKQLNSALNSSHTSDSPLVAEFFQGLVIIFAFALHSLFDGIAIGLGSTVRNTWSLLFAISCHKLVIAFVLGFEFYEQSKHLVIVAILMFLFAIMSPIGIVVIIITEESVFGENSESNPIVILLVAIATGTLLYIVVVEILQKHRCDCISGLVQFFSMATGFALMLIVFIFVSDS